MKPRNLLSGMVILAFTLYGAWRFIMDYLGAPIRAAADYIDNMGAGFWVCLAAAGGITLIASRIRNGRTR